MTNSKTATRILSAFFFAVFYGITVVVLTLLGIFIGQIVVNIQHLDGPVLIVGYVSFLSSLIFALPIAYFVNKRLGNTRAANNERSEPSG